MKKNQMVTVSVKGVPTQGKIVDIRNVEGNGQWIDVNITPDSKPKDRIIKTVRPKSITE